MTADRWSSGDAYESYVGRWSRLVATEFVAWLGVPAGAQWVDVGCGTGALTETVLRDAAPSAVVGVDPSAPFVARARTAVPDALASFVVGDAQALPLPAASADVIASALSLNFVPDARAAVAEARRGVRPGGTLAAYVWDYADGMLLMRHFWDAAVAVDPAAAALDEASRFAICAPDALAAAFGPGADVRGITVPTVFRDFDDYWTPFLGGTGSAPAYVASLDDRGRTALREALRERLPAAADGTIPLTARAWAVRARRAPSGS